ncbi:prolipoprotein diacylglyceryl transferase family protein [Amycolatopsis sp. MtRt-6]|uniref:prolipoprotein diacylglyceryl transferase family protein n=1 Tax=Amycolatopsis sp. MtRt-6 TaxID=2792782 RepID=UPI001A8E0E73|nr:prolipoprotein diacylglyceryl transferase family protein [Amycolatopsis sp. MtRt-6]
MTDATWTVPGRWARRGFPATGAAGLVLALTLSLLLARATGMPVALVPALGAAMLLAFLAVAAGGGLVTGRPRLVCLHGEAAAFAAAAGLLLLLHRPVLDGLGVVAPGVGLFLAAGRIGCLSAGCCHGRPARWGVRYGERHVAAGLPAEYAGVPLVPVAAVEAVALAGTAAVAALVTAGGGPGFGWYLGLHLVVRFWLEFLRGDEDRPVFGLLTEAQWTALAGTGVLVSTPAGPPAPVSAVLVVLLLAGVGVAARRAEATRLCRDGHLRRLAGLVRRAAAAPGDPVLIDEDRGLRLSASHRHYAFSRPGAPLGRAGLAALGRVVAATGPSGRPRRLTSPSGVHHVSIGVDR